MKKLILFSAVIIFAVACQNDAPPQQPAVHAKADSVVVKVIPQSDTDTIAAAVPQEKVVHIIPAVPPPDHSPCDDCPDILFPDGPELKDSSGASLEDTFIYDVYDEPPQFPGGDTALKAFMSRTIHYPESAREQQISGRVFISFIVEKDGSLTDIKVVKEIPGTPEMTAEAIRAVRSMPPWIPGKMNGKIVRAKTILPVRFTLM